MHLGEAEEKGNANHGLALSLRIAAQGLNITNPTLFLDRASTGVTMHPLALFDGWRHTTSNALILPRQELQTVLPALLLEAEPPKTGLGAPSPPDPALL